MQGKGGQIMKDCNNCICLHCGNNDCFVSECEGAKVEPEFLPAAIENCHKVECKGFREEDRDE